MCVYLYIVKGTAVLSLDVLDFSEGKIYFDFLDYFTL